MPDRHTRSLCRRKPLLSEGAADHRFRVRPLMPPKRPISVAKRIDRVGWKPAACQRCRHNQPNPESAFSIKRNTIQPRIKNKPELIGFPSVKLGGHHKGLRSIRVRRRPDPFDAQLLASIHPSGCKARPAIAAFAARCRYASARRDWRSSHAPPGGVARGTTAYRFDHYRRGRVQSSVPENRERTAKSGAIPIPNRGVTHIYKPRYCRRTSSLSWSAAIDPEKRTRPFSRT